MQWGDNKRDLHPVLAVWPEYRPWGGVWQMLEYAESEPHKPAWRDRRIPSPEGHIKADIYRDEQSAFAAAATANVALAQTLEARPLDEILRTSLRLKVRKALQAKERLAVEEKLMLQEAVRRHRNSPRLTVSELELPEKSEKFRDALLEQLNEMPYLQVALFGAGYGATMLYREKGNCWTRPYFAGKKGAQTAQRAKTANAFGFAAAANWGQTKGKIRELLLPRANQLLKLASVQRLLDEARARGERVVVSGNLVFWYEEDESVGWQIKTVAPSEDADGTTIWDQGSILSKNHGRIVVLPYTKEDGEMVNGHTKNAPGDGPAKPRHPDHYVTLPFSRLKDDLMIGLFGELPYE